jgi:hypothetical protein
MRDMFLTIMLVLSFSVEAQTMRDKSGIKTGEAEKTGTFRDRSGIKSGSVENGGTFRDKSGIKIGSYH